MSTILLKEALLVPELVNIVREYLLPKKMTVFGYHYDMRYQYTSLLYKGTIYYYDLCKQRTDYEFAVRPSAIKKVNKKYTKFPFTDKANGISTTGFFFAPRDS